MQPETKDFYTFADFRLDPVEKTLWQAGKTVALTPKVFDTLLVFVENANRLLEKNELIREIWRDSFVEESNLTFNVKTLRRALGDDAQKPRFIETVPRRGYRFIAEVRREAAENHFNGNGRYENNFSSDLAVDDCVAGVNDWQDTPETKEISVPLSSKANGGLDGNSNLYATAIGGSPSRNKSFAASYFGIGLILTVIATIGGCYGLYRWFNAPKSAVIQPVISKSDITRLTSSGNVRSAAVSPDGKFVAYISDDNGKHNF